MAMFMLTEITSQTHLEGEVLHSPKWSCICYAFDKIK